MSNPILLSMYFVGQYCRARFVPSATLSHSFCASTLGEAPPNEPGEIVRWMSPLDSRKRRYMYFVRQNEASTVNHDQPENLARQALGRPLLDSEVTLAETLTAIFGTGRHDLAKVSDELQSRGVARPSGDAGAWSLAVLESELRAINASLDAAHDAGGITRLA
jgi:hypothetical protein